MHQADHQPDWNRIAQKFDLWLPHLAPVGEALMAALEPQCGDHVLDIASGTGEPALSLARRFAGEISVTAIDAASEMVAVAQAKVARAGISHISFEHMAAERLAFADDTFDRALCRFGLMLFDDPLQGLLEMRRTLRRGGRFALSVWGTPDTMTSLLWAYEVLKDRVPETNRPPLARATSLGQPGKLETLLRQAGFRDFAVDTRAFHYRFPTFDAYWELLETSDILGDGFRALPAEERAFIRRDFRRLAATCLRNEGLLIPHQYRLASGYKD